MDVIIIGDYEYNSKDLIGHGAFAVVFKGRNRKVRMCTSSFTYLTIVFVEGVQINRSIGQTNFALVIKKVVCLSPKNVNSR